MDHDYENDLSDDQAIAILRGGPYEGSRDAATHLEVSINGGDIETVRHIALCLLSTAEEVK